MTADAGGDAGAGGELLARLLSEETADERDEVNAREWVGDCDVFTIRAEDVTKWKRTKRRPHVVRIRRWHGAESHTIPGEFPIETVTTAWTFGHWGSGTYEFTAYDSDGNYCKRAKHSLGAVPAPSLPGMPSSSSSAAQPNSLGQLGELIQLMAALKAAGLVGAEQPRDSMRDAVAAIVQATQAQATMLTQHLTATKPPASDINAELLKALLAQRQAPAQSPREVLAEAVQLAKLFQTATGSPTEKTDLALLAEVARPALPGILGLLVHLAPPAQRDAYLELLQAGMAAEGATDAAGE